jgi:hypothetical protein
VEQKREPTNRNRIRGIPSRAKGQPTNKPISIKDSDCRSGGCALKAVELTPGDLAGVLESGLRDSRESLIACQKSAEGIVRSLT